VCGLQRSRKGGGVTLEEVVVEWYPGGSGMPVPLCLAAGGEEREMAQWGGGGGGPESDIVRLWRGLW
jgi:hypothetical protein